MSTGSALGAKIEYADYTLTDGEPADITYAELLNCGDYDFPLGTFAKLDTTVHASAKKKYAPGIKDGGTVSVPLVWDDELDSHQWVEDNLHVKAQFRYTPKDGTPIEFLAILKGLVAANPVGTGPKLRTLMLRRSGGVLAEET